MKHTHTKFGGMIDCDACHPAFRINIKQTLRTIGYTIALLIILDVTILLFSMAQIVAENRTGHWAPFWRIQAEFIIKHL